MSAVARGQAQVLRGNGGQQDDQHAQVCSCWILFHHRQTWPGAPVTLWSSLYLTQVLLLLGTLVFAMSLQLDRRGAWNMMGPCLFAFVIMVTMWVRSSKWIRECGLPTDPHSGKRETGPSFWPCSWSWSESYISAEGFQWHL